MRILFFISFLNIILFLAFMTSIDDKVNELREPSGFKSFLRGMGMVLGVFLTRKYRLSLPYNSSIKSPGRKDAEALAKDWEAISDAFRVVGEDMGYALKQFEKEHPEIVSKSKKYCR